MAGALGSQYLGGLYPCEMCYWQRWPHYAAIAIALVAFIVKPPMRNVLVALAALAVLTSGAIGVYHAGVEYHWWAGPPCSANGAGMTLEQIMRAPLIRCDAPQPVRRIVQTSEVKKKEYFRVVYKPLLIKMFFMVCLNK